MSEHNVYTLAVVLDWATCTHATNAARSAGAQWPCSTCAARAVVAAGWVPAAPLLSLIDDLRDPDPCWYDHHGYCQAHGWTDTEPECPHARAQRILAKRPAGSPPPAPAGGKRRCLHEEHHYCAECAPTEPPDPFEPETTEGP